MAAFLCAGLMTASASGVWAGTPVETFTGEQSETGKQEALYQRYGWGQAEESSKSLKVSEGSEHKASVTKKKKKKNKNSQSNSNQKTQGTSASENNKDSTKDTEEARINDQNDKTGKETDEIKVEEDKDYTSKDEVAAYLNEFGHLPDNYISKNEAKDLGWVNSKGNLDDVAPGKSIGGDYFGNYENKLPTKKGRKYYECDIDFDGGRRNAKRIIYSNDGLVFYTEDHYETFEQLYPKEDKK